jgi:transcriptional pleiotropic regulator of transition state genes
LLKEEEMKSIGIVRQLDELGRVVLPKELRKRFNLAYKDTVEIFINGEEIILKKYDPACVFCGSQEEVNEVHGKPLCAACLKEIKKSR